ncbi:Rap1a/Tai family immunity protein [Sphingobium sp. CCH11-B1]|jgi:hypothetical protein|uniref:Rap1a/Tai family immunity protein n=1 Tax=Sphingobium sp. CCH11-B1 TaxID=1768781 RepID=UPI00082F1530|nr:Rap1a/Tai family immunity protein [Sphingobium sp. CCH11-B1]MEA3387821.1 Rap1a/Tai family immunity protein [Pseudomonadota bacterium]
MKISTVAGIGAAVTGLAFLPLPAQAGFYSGDALYESCSTPKDSKDYFERSYECVGYISGAVDAFNTTREANGLKSCIPADVTIADLRKTTVDYLSKNPRDRAANSASSQVFAATRKAWPCKAAAKKARSNKKR